MAVLFKLLNIQEEEEEEEEEGHKGRNNKNATGKLKGEEIKRDIPQIIKRKGNIKKNKKG